MSLHTSTGSPTKNQQQRFEAMKLDIGCICCRLKGLGHVEPDINHSLTARKRRGHDFTYPLCKWHHVGWLADGYTTETMTKAFGPSLAKGSKPFHAHFGSDDELTDAVGQMLLRCHGIAA